MAAARETERMLRPLKKRANNAQSVLLMKRINAYFIFGCPVNYECCIAPFVLPLLLYLFF